MENASNALIMAGGVLIGVLILSLAVYLITDFGSTSAKLNAKQAEQQIVEFNTKFTSYEGRNNITIYEIISLAKYAIENNKYYEYSNTEGPSPETNYIGVYLNGTELKKSSDDFQNDIQKYINNEVATDKDKGYKCTKIGYNSSGRVNKIEFQKNI